MLICNNLKKIKIYIVISFFICGVLLWGGLSFTKLANYYINDELSYTEWTADLGSKLETDIASTFLEKFEFVNINGAFRNLLHQHEMNGVIKLNNGYLTTVTEQYTDDYLSSSAEKVIELSEYIQKKGKKLVYAATPSTCSKYDPQLPIGVVDYYNNNTDRFLEILQDGNVDTIDFRKEMYDDGIDQYEMMYKTDHHWTTESGFWAYKKFEQYIIDSTGCSVDPRISDMDYYNVVKYKHWHLGSRGQRTGIYYAGVDDFDLIIPIFETSLTSESGEVGEFQDLVINKAALDNKDYRSRYTYDFVLDPSFGHFINNKCDNNIKVLVVSDSFSKAVAPYLEIGFKEVQIVNGEQGYDKNFIDEYDPDIVIVMFYYF